jgi:hypothetical protein
MRFSSTECAAVILYGAPPPEPVVRLVLALVAEHVRRHGADPALALFASQLAATLPPGAADDGRNVTSEAPSWLTTRDYAAAMHISERAARDRCASGRLPGAVRREGRWLIPT